MGAPSNNHIGGHGRKALFNPDFSFSQKDTPKMPPVNSGL